MGQERITRAFFRGAEGESVSEGKALLETAELLFRGDFRLRIPFREVEAIEVSGGLLAVRWPGGEATFELGKDAAVWASKVKNPRGLLDKLGVKAGQRCAVIGVEDDGFLAQLRARTPEVAADAAARNLDFVFYEADEVEDLARLPELRASIKDNGVIWVVSLKGKGARVRDVDVIAAAKAAGLVDTKVVAFSETHTALKLVVPVALRARTPRQG